MFSIKSGMLFCDEQHVGYIDKDNNICFRIDMWLEEKDIKDIAFLLESLKPTEVYLTFLKQGTVFKYNKEDEHTHTRCNCAESGLIYVINNNTKTISLCKEKLVYVHDSYK